MFKYFPYTGWLLVAVFLWGFVGYRSFQHRQLLQPEAIARTIASDIQQREASLNQLLEQPDLFQKMFANKLSASEATILSEKPFSLYAFDGDVLLFWNNNSVVATCDQDSLIKDNNSLFRYNGNYFRKCLQLPFLKPGQRVVVLFPISNNYPFENEYLHSHFVAADYIPPGTKVLRVPSANTYSVKHRDGTPLFFIQVDEKDIPDWFPENLMISGIIAALLVSVIWVSLIAITLARKKGPKYGLLFLIGFIFLIRGISYWKGYPFHLGETILFSPELYASSKMLPSLGDLILNLLCGVWITVFIINNFPEHRVIIKSGRKFIDASIGIALMILLVGSSFLSADMLRNLVIDSKISFDVSNLNTLTGYTILALFTISLIACFVSLIIYLIHAQFRSFVPNKWIRYVLLLMGGIIFYVLERNQISCYEYYAFGWLLVFVVLLDISALSKSDGLINPNMIFWAAFTSLFATLALQHFNEIKGKENRRLFAERIVNQRDNVMEYLFFDIAQRISRDSLLPKFFKAPYMDARTIIDEYLSTTYLRGQLNRYDSRVYLFDKTHQPLQNEDTTGFSVLNSITRAAIPVNNYLYYRENAKDAHYYIAFIPVRNDSAVIEGYVFMDMTLKKVSGASVYPELLQPGKLKEEQHAGEYSYAVYVDRKLITQTNDYPFPAFQRNDSLAVGMQYLLDKNDHNEVWYRVDKEKTVVIILRQDKLFEDITVFSYLLGMLILLILFIFLLRLFILSVIRKDPEKKLIHLTLRKRIHLAMLGVVLVSFLIIGAVTIWFFLNRYDVSNRDALQTSMQVIERSVQQWLKDENIPADEFSFNTAAEEPVFKYFINNLANSQNIDLNIYNSYGSLKTTSQEDIYNKSILARIMAPDAYYQFSQQSRPVLVQDEHIGDLNYLSGYLPLSNEAGRNFGYINVPFFASQKEINYQISNILIALINLYAIIFLFSSLVALVITNWLTGKLQVIITKFGQFSLGKNEQIEWKQDDEIGLLIREYNKMVKKVEENAALLAQRERESAWREMARQVAHEIKNPLTPMKLNIQYLQQALQTNHPNIQQLTANVSESLIEQINNLSHIASAFSDFATMPEAKPEEISLNELLHKSVELFLNNEKVKVVINITEEPLLVKADKSQLLRVFTNLLQNAMEAIPEEKEGYIIVALKREGAHAVISIKDNGGGIPDEVQEKIFNPYFTTKGSGTGLGLAMTKKIIEFWKGKIWFETKEDEGTTFFIRLLLIMETE